MAQCEVCGNDYDKSFEVMMGGRGHTFDSFECAIHALAPRCEHCGCMLDQLRLKIHDPALIDPQCSLRGAINAREIAVAVAVADPADSRIGFEKGQKLVGQVIAVACAAGDGHQAFAANFRQRFNDRRCPHHKIAGASDSVAGDFAKKLVGQRGGARSGAAMRQPRCRSAREKHQDANSQNQSASVAQLHFLIARQY